ncbi:MAG TPA: adenylate/guanylate cyclase domain-containing protein [Actinomycetota bacterium]|nr:adenylate/guanylate cyclase domain-containing protein [Actinomycetota bacterium]
MSVCSNCGTENQDEARFCLSCGSSLVPACSVCGAELPPEARFCPSCGAPVAEAGSAPVGQERRLVTILFADVTGSTGLGERLDPERLQEVLATYFGAMREEIEAEGGTVEKFIGDAVMAAFGVPVAHEDDPIRALRAALRMRRRLVEVNTDLRSRFGVELQIRTGINTGEVLAATTPQPGEPMVTGDAVNVAARLEQLAEPDQIVVAERTARAARGFHYRELGDQDLRGKEEAVPAVLLEEEAPEHSQRGVPGLRAPMVGRDQELTLLRTVYGRTVAEGRANLVTIYGDPGVGKSRLTTEFLSWVQTQEPQPRVLRGRCLPYGDGITYWPLAEILKSHSGVLDTDASDEVMDKLQFSCDAVLEADPSIDAVRTCRAIAYTVGLEFGAASMRDLEPRQVRAEMHHAWRSFFSALALGGPVVAVIEDIHWADPALLDLLEEMADKVLGPVLFVCPARHELTDNRPGWGGGRRNHSAIALEPLSPEESDHLVRLLLTVADLPASVHDQILERAEGNPFFLEEIVRHLIDVHAIVREGDRWRAAGSIGDVDIPDTVQAVLAARIDLLAPEEKRALQRAAVVGRVFWPGPVRRLLNGDGDRIGQTLDRLEERELVLSRLGSSVAGEPEFIFKHVLTRDVAYESLPRRERGPAHEEVARWIEETAGTRGREFGELLAYHYVEALAAREDVGEGREALRRRAFTALLEVAGEARSRFANEKAMKTAERAGELAEGPIERIAVLEEIGLIALNDYQGDLSWQSLREAVDLRLTHAPEDRRAIAWACARAVENPLRWPGSMKDQPGIAEVEGYLQVGFEHLGAEGSEEEEIRLLTARAFEPFGYGWRVRIDDAKRESALQAGIRAAELARAMGRPELESAALDGASSAVLNVGLYGDIRELMARRLELAKVIEDPWELGDLYGMGAWEHTMVGEYAEAVRLGLIGVEVAEGAEGLNNHCLNWAGASQFQLGEWDQALGAFDRAVALLGARAEDPPYFMMNVYGAAAFVLEARGFEEAEDRLAVLERSRGSIHGGSVMASYWLAWAISRRGEHARAWELVEEATVEGMVMRPFQDQVAAELLAVTARWEEVPTFLEQSRAYAQAAKLKALPAHLDRLEGRSAVAVGEPERGLQLLEQAHGELSDLGAAWERARTELDIAEVLAATDRAEEARATLASAKPDLERAGALIELERFRDLAARLGD